MQQSAKQQDYLKAKGVCLEGNGYSVKWRHLPDKNSSRIGH